MCWEVSLQVSGYIDFAHRLKADPHMEAYFERTKRLMPNQSDLSFYNWETHLSTSNPTPNFQVLLLLIKEAATAAPASGPAAKQASVARVTRFTFHDSTACSEAAEALQHVAMSVYLGVQRGAWSCNADMQVVCLLLCRS